MKTGENAVYTIEGKTVIENGIKHEEIKEDSKLILEIELS